MPFLSRKPLIGWLVAWCLAAVLYALAAKVPISRAYLDFGDGNYQYISWRQLQGVRLYTDILSPQPPFHLWLGAGLVKLAGVIGVEPLVVFRWGTHLIRLATSGAVFGGAWLLFGRGGIAFLASLLFLFLPEGYRWSQTYQSEHLELLFLTLGWMGCLTRAKWGGRVGGICSVCAIWTNMSALPFSLLLALMAWMFSPCRWSALFSVVATLAALLAVSLGMAGTAYFENVWSNQVASFPSGLDAWVRSLYEQGTTLIQLEGPVILLALIGLYRFLQKHNQESAAPWSPGQRILVTLYGIASIGSAIYVVKGGTVDYIFILAEPALAVFAAAVLVETFGDSGVECRVGLAPPGSGWWGKPHPTQIFHALSRTLLLAGVVALLVWAPMRFNTAFRSQAGPGDNLPDVSAGRVVEFSDVEARTIERVIHELSKPGDLIWAPPYFAALTGHPIAMDLSETYLWFVRWAHSAMGGKADPAVDQMISGLVELVEKEGISVMLLNDRTAQWGELLVPDREYPTGGGQSIPLRKIDPRIDRLQASIETHYQPILAKPGSTSKLYFQGWNERLEVWVPKGGPVYLPPWVTEGFAGIP
jgi:hypothetical protein